MKVVRLSVLRTGRLYPPGNIAGTHFCQRLSRPQGHSAAGRMISMKNSNDTIGNQTRDLPACSAVPQPTAAPAACRLDLLYFIFYSSVYYMLKNNEEKIFLKCAWVYRRCITHWNPCQVIGWMELLTMKSKQYILEHRT
jgi:hypothetical protein